MAPTQTNFGELIYDATQKPRRSLWQQAQDAIKIRGEKPYEFTPIHIEGESLSETIIRERRGEL